MSKGAVWTSIVLQIFEIYVPSAQETGCCSMHTPAGCHMSFWTSANAFVAVRRCPLECRPEPLSQSSMASGTCVEAAYLHGLTSAMHFIMLLVKCMAEVHRMHFKDVARVASCELGRFWLRDLSKLHLLSIGEWLWRRVCCVTSCSARMSYDVSISENEESRTLPFPLILSHGVQALQLYGTRL